MCVVFSKWRNQDGGCLSIHMSFLSPSFPCAPHSADYPRFLRPSLLSLLLPLLETSVLNPFPSFSFCVSSAGEPVDECGQWGTARQVQRHLHLSTHQVHTHTPSTRTAAAKNVDTAGRGGGPRRIDQALGSRVMAAAHASPDMLAANFQAC